MPLHVGGCVSGQRVSTEPEITGENSIYRNFNKLIIRLVQRTHIMLIVLNTNVETITVLCFFDTQLHIITALTRR